MSEGDDGGGCQRVMAYGGFRGGSGGGVRGGSAGGVSEGVAQGVSEGDGGGGCQREYRRGE